MPIYFTSQFFMLVEITYFHTHAHTHIAIQWKRPYSD